MEAGFMAVIGLAILCVIAALLSYTFNPSTITGVANVPSGSGITISVPGTTLNPSNLRPITVQVKRAPDVSGSPGSFSNIGSSWTDPGDGTGATVTFNDTTGVMGTPYWYEVTWTDVTPLLVGTSNQVRVFYGGNVTMFPTSNQR